MGKKCIGIDVGGTSVKIGLFETTGDLLLKWEVPTRKEEGGKYIIGDVAVPISLSLRLFANVLSGTVMMALVYGLLKWFAVIWPAALHVYFDLFSGAIQTYVFCMLTMTYISDAIGDD